MRLGAKARYAVMAMADLARHGCGRNTVTLAEIAARQSISLPYLEQLFAQLRRRGLVRSLRGRGGGYALAAPAAEIAIHAVISAVDEPLHATRCNGGVGCMGEGARCDTHELWDALGRTIEDFLAGVSLEDVIEHRVRVAAPSRSPVAA